MEVEKQKKQIEEDALNGLELISNIKMATPWKRCGPVRWSGGYKLSQYLRVIPEQTVISYDRFSEFNIYALRSYWNQLR